MVPGCVPFKIVSDSPTLHSRWLLFFKVMIISLWNLLQSHSIVRWAIQAQWAEPLVYSIYFIIQFNIELIFANTSIIEYYWFFSDVEHFFPGIAPLVSILLFPKNIDDFSLLIQKITYSKFKVYCKQNRHFYRDFFLGIPDFFNFILL